MPGLKANGAEYTAANGYRYIKVDGNWRLKHHVVAEEKLGRPLMKSERVYFDDKDRTNFDPDNIVVRNRQHGKEDRIAYLKTKIRVLQEELEELEQS